MGPPIDRGITPSPLTYACRNEKKIINGPSSSWINGHVFVLSFFCRKELHVKLGVRIVEWTKKVIHYLILLFFWSNT